MIVLDTNVLSEILRPKPAEPVVRWLDEQPAATVFVTTVTQAEILYGVELLPEGRRKRALIRIVEEIFREDFAGRVLPFDAPAARAYAEIAAARRRKGRPISQFDAQIAAICRACGARLATRNTQDFEDCGIGLIDPRDF